MTRAEQGQASVTPRVRPSQEDTTLRAGLCVPTLNAGQDWPKWLETTLLSAKGMRILVVDSSSDDSTAELARKAGCEVHSISRCDFDHGATRDEALSLMNDIDIVIFLTQDALVADPDALKRLVASFEDPDIGAVYGRQLPHADATPVAAHARLFNYPPRSHEVKFDEIDRWGIKAAFLSNSFAAYRYQALIGVGGFPAKTILGEDMIAGAKLLDAGWKLGYCAEACAYHSHNYTIFEEFKRYFDIGVLHARQQWLIAMLGRAEGEGKRFVISELRYLAKNSPLSLPGALTRNLMKYLGYKLGQHEEKLSGSIKRRISMHKSYWRDH